MNDKIIIKGAREHRPVRHSDPPAGGEESLVRSFALLRMTYVYE